MSPTTRAPSSENRALEAAFRPRGRCSSGPICPASFMEAARSDGSRADEGTSPQAAWIKENEMKPFIFVAIAATVIAASPSFAQSDTDRLNALEERLQQLESRQHEQAVETMIDGFESDHLHGQMLNDQLTHDLDEVHH